MHNLFVHVFYQVLSAKLSDLKDHREHVPLPVIKAKHHAQAIPIQWSYLPGKGGGRLEQDETNAHEMHMTLTEISTSDHMIETFVSHLDVCGLDLTHLVISQENIPASG